MLPADGPANEFAPTRGTKSAFADWANLGWGARAGGLGAVRSRGFNRRVSYAVSESSDGFRIKHPRRATVTVRLDERAFVIASGDGPDTRCGLYEELTPRVGRHLLQGRFLPQDESYFERRAINGSMLRHEFKAISHIVRAQRERLLAKVDPTVVAVQRAVFLATHGHADLAEHEALYREPYIVRDVLNYRAAAIALWRVGVELWPDENIYAQEPYEAHTCPPPEERIRALCNWRGLFSSSGLPYRSLDRTLMNLSPTVPARDVSCLRFARLERPIVEPLVLRAFLERVSLAQMDPSRGLLCAATASQIRILQHATEDEIRRALVRFATRTGSSLNTDWLVNRMVWVLSEYREPHRGRLGGLLEKAMRWDARRGFHPDTLQEALDELDGPETRTARPPIPLPSVPGVTFLTTVGDIVQEGLRMQHCIVEEASKAVHGYCFLFHVERHGEPASIEVSSNGEVMQGSGLRNCENNAARWGAAWLRFWGRALGAGFPAT